MRKTNKKIFSLVIIVFLLLVIISCDTSSIPEPPSFLANFYGMSFNGMNLQYTAEDSTKLQIACTGYTSLLYTDYGGSYTLSIGGYIKDLDTVYTCSQNGILNYSLGEYTQPTKTTPGYWTGTITFYPDSGKAWGGNFQYYVSYNTFGTVLLFDHLIKLPIDNTSNKYFYLSFFSTDYILWQGCE